MLLPLGLFIEALAAYLVLKNVSKITFSKPEILVIFISVIVVITATVLIIASRGIGGVAANLGVILIFSLIINRKIKVLQLSFFYSSLTNVVNLSNQ